MDDEESAIRWARFLLFNLKKRQNLYSSHIFSSLHEAKMSILSIFYVVLLLLVRNSLTCGHLPREVIDGVPRYAQIPSSALGIALNSDGYGVEAFGKGAYMVTGKKNL